jgi:hypothetical protein
MLSLESRRYIKEASARFDVIVNVIKQQLVEKPSEFWEAVAYALEDYRNHVHGAWLTNTVLEIGDGTTEVCCSIYSILVTCDDPKKVVEYRYSSLAVPHLIQPFTEAAIRKVDEEVAAQPFINRQPMARIWWTGVKWLLGKGWVAPVYNFDPESRKLVTQLLSPCKLKLVTVVLDYAVIAEESEWLHVTVTKKDAKE